MTIPPFTVRQLGIDAIVVDFGNVISEELNDLVVAAGLRIESDPFTGFLEVVPAFSSLTVFFDPLTVRQKFPDRVSGRAVADIVTVIIRGLPEIKAARSLQTFEIPVDFSAEAAPDLEFVAQNAGLSVSETVSLFTARTYRVFMLGFLPGFAYMGEIDERLAAPRRSTPRTKIEKGSVGIAGRQTGIYPLESPGGWQIIGRTDIELFTPDAAQPTLLSPGDEVRFRAI